VSTIANNLDRGVTLQKQCDFPNSHTGAPISNEIAPPPDLEEYMRSCGPFADPVFTETAGLMMEKEMTNSARDRHLQSGIVSSGSVTGRASQSCLPELQV
jgi:hypothetical protein